MRNVEDVKRLERSFPAHESLKGWIQVKCWKHDIRNCNACVSAALAYKQLPQIYKRNKNESKS